MRRSWSGLIAGLLVITATGGAAAQDEEQRMGDDPAYAQRVEVPEAGIAMTLPAGWTHEIVMESAEYQLPAEFDDGSAVPHTLVSSATTPGFGTCLLSTYEDMPMSIERHALERGQQNTSSLVDEDPVISEIQRTAGPAIRVDFRSMLGWGHEYVFDMAGLRYVLSCFDVDLGDETFWPIADSIELLDTPVDEPDATDPSEASIEDRRVEFDEFGIGLTIPHLWTYELRQEETEYPLPDEFGEDATVPRTQFLSAFPFTDGLCWVSSYAEMPMDPAQHAHEHGWAQYSSLSESTPETERVQLPAGEAYRVVYYSVFGGSVAYAFDLAGSRYLVDCVVGRDGGFAARSLAASITALGDEPPELGLQRLEFADADIAVTLPVDWEVQSVMEFIDTINVAGPEAPESDLWVVMHAFPDEETWCDTYMLSDIPLSLEDHGHVFALLAAANDPPNETEMGSTTLPIGDAVRVVETSGEAPVKTSYLFDVGDNREYLVCSTSEQPDDAWLSIAQSIESLSAASPIAGLERVEVPEAGVAVSFPAGWDVDIELEYDENVPGDPETGFWRVLYADGGEDGWCDLTRNLSPVGEIADQISVTADQFLEFHGGDATTQTTPVQLAAGDAWRLDVQVPEGPYFTTGYIVDPPVGHLGEPSRFTLACQTTERDARDWLDVAETLEWLEPDEPDDFGLERVHSLEAGVSLGLPPDWTVELRLEDGETVLPDAYADAAPIAFRDLLIAESDTGGWCLLRAHPENPMPLHDQASWNTAKLSAAFPDLSVELYSTGDQGEKRYIIVSRGADPNDGANIYFFESYGERYELQCTGTFGPDSPWDAIAATVAPLEAVPPGTPEDEVGRSELTDIVTVLPVSGVESGPAIMTAECERVSWIEYADGSFEERLECVLTDEPVDPPQDQGGLPQERLPLSGGECEWISDFWVETDGSEVWASSWSVNVEPDGTATAISRYAAEELGCEG